MPNPESPCIRDVGFGIEGKQDIKKTGITPNSLVLMGRMLKQVQAVQINHPDGTVQGYKSFGAYTLSYTAAASTPSSPFIMRDVTNADVEFLRNIWGFGGASNFCDLKNPSHFCLRDTGIRQSTLPSSLRFSFAIEEYLVIPINQSFDNLADGRYEIMLHTANGVMNAFNFTVGSGSPTETVGGGSGCW
ncbi:MAG: hypothetical protein KIH69_014315 [Anaerolineae bacterium]|nr:hypothetical protein [Anaerolineae bacterium]